MVARMIAARAYRVRYLGMTNTKGARWTVQTAGGATMQWDATMHTMDEAVSAYAFPQDVSEAHKAELPNGDVVYTIPKI
jgi:hypothetical protein